MCNVYEFPTKVKLTEEMEERLYEAGKNYAKVLYDTLEDLYPDVVPHDTEEEELMEVLIGIYTRGITDVMEEMED